MIAVVVGCAARGALRGKCGGDVAQDSILMKDVARR